MDTETLAFDPPVGIAQTLEPGLQRVLAPNASPMTFRGTNTYLLGTRGIAVIDPGPDDPAHLDAICNALEPHQHISHILVTHAHVDHSPLSRALSDRTGAAVYAYGDAQAGRSLVMSALVNKGLASSGEGIDAAFVPDHTLAHMQTLTGDGWEVTAHHTPGHFGNHLAFEWNDACFVGDLVMGWASSLVSPPDGDLTDFMASCVRLRAQDWRIFHAGHGAPITEPRARLDWLIAHRQGREADILEALKNAPARAYDLACHIYTQTPPALMGAATRNVLAHLVDLSGRGLVSPQGEIDSDAIFELIKKND